MKLLVSRVPSLNIQLLSKDFLFDFRSYHVPRGTERAADVDSLMCSLCKLWSIGLGKNLLSATVFFALKRPAEEDSEIVSSPESGPENV